jgi:hypothetical protein
MLGRNKKTIFSEPALLSRYWRDWRDMSAVSRMELLSPLSKPADTAIQIDEGDR